MSSDGRTPGRSVDRTQIATSAELCTVLQRLDLLDLPTLLFGWHEGWVDRAQVVGVAVDQLVATPGVDDPELAFLAGADDEDDEEIDALLHRLAERSSPVSSEEIQRRWWLAHLDCLLRLGLEPEEQIQTAEQLWADLGYPPSSSR